MNFLNLRTNLPKKSQLDKYLDSSKEFIVQNKIIYCKYCYFSISKIDEYSKKKLESHCKSNRHRERMEIRLSSENRFNNGEFYSIKFLKLFMSFLNANKLSFNCLNNEATKNLLNFLGYPLYSDEFYRESLMPEIFEIEKNNIYNKFINKSFCLSFDESKLSYLGDVLAIDMSKLSSKKFIIDIKKINTKDSNTIFNEIELSLKKVNQNFIEKNQFKVLITDGATVCRKVGKMFKEKYGVKHVICLCHNLHNLAETVRKELKTLGHFLEVINIKWSKGHHFKQCWNISKSLPKFPSYVTTRWGTWIESALFFKDHFAEILGVFSKFREGSKSIKVAEKQYKQLLFEFKLLEEVKSLPSVIKNLEKTDLTLKEQLNIFFSVKNSLKTKIFSDRFDQIVDKNVDLKFFIDASKNLRDCKFKHFKYVNLTNANIERSFSEQKQFISSQGNNLTVKKLFQRLITK